jgi:formylglycine-generating enzyme required for sulfatase activity
MSCCGALAMLRPAAEPVVPATARTLDPTGMARIPGGAFLMGYEGADTFLDDGEGPVREVTLSPYWIDAKAVSNAEFARFIQATGHTTDAEREGWSFVFHALLRPDVRAAVRDTTVPDAPWWLALDGAQWRHPQGPGSTLAGREDHPVVHVSWNDAAAYAAWCGKRLPTEAEWENAARGGLHQAPYPWGHEFKPQGRHRCNTWQGRFPDIDTGDDGHVGTCPVDAFEPNGFGLYNTSGNVWEWCADWWSPWWHTEPSDATRRNPRGPERGEDKVIRGGSYLCHASYCNRYRVSARHHNGVTASTGHMGLRCAADAG